MDKTPETPRYWSWRQAAFALAGILLFIFASYGPPASSSGFISTLKGALDVVAPAYAESKIHYRIIPGPGSWVMAFVLGMAIGGFLGGRMTPGEVRDVPEIWEARYGPCRVKRCLVAFLGGFLILFSSRLAGGCTLGLFISGGAQLAVSGLYFGGVIFVFAMLTARLLYGRPGKGGES